MDISEAMAPVGAAQLVTDVTNRLRKDVEHLKTVSRGGIDINALENAVERLEEASRNALHQALQKAAQDVTDLT